MIELVRPGCTPAELAQEFESNAQTSSNWVTQANRDADKRNDAPTNEQLDELKRLRRESRRLREERETLPKAAAWFAQETDTPPNGSSSSSK